MQQNTRTNRAGFVASAALVLLAAACGGAPPPAREAERPPTPACDPAMSPLALTMPWAAQRVDGSFLPVPRVIGPLVVHQEAIASCFAVEGGAHAVEVALTIDGNGRVTAIGEGVVERGRSTPLSATLQACLARALGNVGFDPAPEGSVTYVLPFRFANADCNLPFGQ